MTTTIEHQSQLQELEQKKNSLSQEINLLKKQEANLSDLPEIADLFREKNCLRKELFDLQRSVWQNREQLKKSETFLARLKIAKQGNLRALKIIIKEIPKYFLTLHALGRRGVSLSVAMEFLNATDAIKDFERNMNADKPYKERELLVVQAMIKQKENRLAMLDNHFQQIRQSLRVQIKEKEKETEALSEKIQILLPPLMPNHQTAKTDSPTVSYRLPHRRSSTRKKEKPMENVIEEPVKSPAPWQLFIVFDDKERGIPLPLEPKDFARCIRPMLQERKLNHLDCQALYRKLMEQLVKPRHQRQRLNQIKGKKMFHGWKKVKVDRFHRLLCDFKEQERIVRFSLQTHDVYQKIWRA